MTLKVGVDDWTKVDRKSPPPMPVVSGNVSWVDGLKLELTGFRIA